MSKSYPKLLKTGFLYPVLQLTSASVLGQLLILISLPLITRLYEPAAFGLFGVFNAIIGIFLVISSLRFELAIPMASHERNAEQVFSLSIAISIVFAAVALLAVEILSVFFSKSLEIESADDLIWLIPVALLSGGIFKALNYLYIWRGEYKRISQSKVLQSVAFVLTQISLGLAGLSTMGLAFGLILGQLVGAAWLIKDLSVLKIFGVFCKSPLRTLSLMRENKNYAKYDVAAAFINAISQHIPSILLALLFSPKFAGLFYLADRMLSVPSGMFGRAVGQVLHGHIRHDKSANLLQARVHKICVVMILLVFIPAYVIHYHAYPLFQVIFGQPWGLSGVVASWLILGIAVQFIYTPLSPVLITTGGQHKHLGIHIFLLITKVLGLLAGYLADDFFLAVQCLVVAQVLGYGIALILTLQHTRMVNMASVQVR